MLRMEWRLVTGVVGLETYTTSHTHITSRNRLQLFKYKSDVTTNHRWQLLIAVKMCFHLQVTYMSIVITFLMNVQALGVDYGLQV